MFLSLELCIYRQTTQLLMHLFRWLRQRRKINNLIFSAPLSVKIAQLFIAPALKPRYITGVENVGCHFFPGYSSFKSNHGSQIRESVTTLCLPREGLKLPHFETYQAGRGWQKINFKNKWQGALIIITVSCPTSGQQRVK